MSIVHHFTSDLSLPEPVLDPPVASGARSLDTAGRSLEGSARSEPVVERLVSNPEQPQRTLERSKRGFPDLCRIPTDRAEVACDCPAIPANRSKVSGCIAEVDFTLPGARFGPERAGMHHAGSQITRPESPIDCSEIGFSYPEIPPGRAEVRTGFGEVDAGCREIRTDAAERDCLSDGIDPACPYTSRWQS